VTGKRHDYQVIVTWTGNLGKGTASYTAYSRDHDVTGEAKPTIPGTADPVFRGDPTRWNPEELLVASLSQCHMLEFLAQAARAGVVVTRYVDEPSGTMIEAGDGGSFVEVILHPRVTVAGDNMVDACARLHEEAHRTCYIASSVVFPVRLEAVTEVDGRPASPDGMPAETPHEVPSILDSVLSAQPDGPPIEPPPSATVRHLHHIGHVVRDIDARLRSTGGWVSLYRHRHFPRSPRVQENARAPSESGIHMSRSAITSSSWSVWQTTVRAARWALTRPSYRCRPLQQSWTA